MIKLDLKNRMIHFYSSVVCLLFFAPFLSCYIQDDTKLRLSKKGFSNMFYQFPNILTNRLTITIFSLSFFFSSYAYSEQNITNDWFTVESLISEGGAIIDTGVSQSNAMFSVKIDCVVEITEKNWDKKRLMGFMGKAKNWFGINTKNLFEFNGIAKIEAELGVKYRLVAEQTVTGSFMRIYDVSHNEEGIILGIIKDKTIHPFNDCVCKIFGLGNWLCDHIKLYSFKIYVDNELRANFLPVFDKKNHEGGMFDLVSGKLFTNSGKGFFLPGEQYKFNSRNQLNTSFKDVDLFLSSNQSSSFKDIPYSIEREDYERVEGQKIIRYFIMSLLLSLILSGIYFIIKDFFLAYESLIPLFIVGLITLFLYFCGIFRCLYLSLIIILLVSFTGWIKVIISVIKKDLNCLFFAPVWCFFLFGLFFLAFNSSFLTLEGKKAILQYIPSIRHICNFGYSNDYLLNHELASLGVLAWFCHKFAFLIFDHGIVLFSQSLIVWASFLTVFVYFQSNTFRYIFLTIILLLSLFLINTCDSLSVVLGSLFLLVSGIIILLSCNSITSLYKLFAMSLVVIVFLAILASPCVFEGNYLRYIYPSGLFSIYLIAIWVVFLRNVSLRAFFLLLPSFFLLLLLSPREQIFIPPILFIFLLVMILLRRSNRRLIFKKSFPSQNFFALLISVTIFLSFSIFLSIKTSSTVVKSDHKYLNSNFYRSFLNCPSIIYRGRAKTGTMYFKKIYQIIDDTLKTFQFREENKCIISPIHILIFSSIIFIYLIFLQILNLIFDYNRRNIFLIMKSFLVYMEAVMIPLIGIYIYDAIFCLQTESNGLYIDGTDLFFPFTSLVIMSLSLISLKALSIFHRYTPAFSFFVFLLMIPALLYYSWMPNIKFVFKGAPINDNNRNTREIIMNSYFDNYDKFSLLNDEPIDLLGIPCFYINFEKKAHKLTALIKTDEELTLIKTTTFQNKNYEVY